MIDDSENGDSESGAWKRALDRGCLQQFPDAADGSDRVGKAPPVFTLLVGFGCAIAAVLWARGIGDPVALDDEPLFVGGAADNPNHRSVG